MDKNEMLDILKGSFPDAQIELKDFTGGGDHWQLIIKSNQFKGISLVKQHQLVYKALGDLMKEKIHALALTTSAVD